MGALLECRGLDKRFGERQAVDGITFSIDAGEVYGLLGPNGAGKTTTIKMVCGLLRPDGGSVEIKGRALDRDLSARALIGYVPQETFLFHDTVRANLLWARPEATEAEVRTALRTAAAE